MKLLLAEDERDLSNAIKRVLEYSKYEVVCAYESFLPIKAGYMPLDMMVFSQSKLSFNK